MKYCTHCGNKNEEDSVFCVHCGRPFEEVKKMVNRYAEKISETDKVERKGQVSTKEASSSKYMSKVELWSWLKRQSQRQKYFTEEKSDLSFNDFINKVNHKMQENEVPASLEVKKIQWDRENVSQTVCYVEPDTNVANPLTRLIHFEHIGKFTFVEEKTFITPPDLPEVPRKEKKISSLLKNWIIFVLIGVALKLITGFNYGGDVNFYSDDSYSVISIALIVIGICLFIKYMMVIGYNNSCKKQEKNGILHGIIGIKPFLHIPFKKILMDV